jgi:IS4 transposase
MISNFRQIVRKYLSHLPQDDYPVLDSFKFVSIWLSFVLDQSQTSMRSVFKRLNARDSKLDISTFSKASKNRSPDIFKEIWEKQKREVMSVEKKKNKGIVLFPLDSTIVSLTSKLLWQQGFHQVKLFSGINLATGAPEGIVIHFGQGHDSKYGDETIDATPENGVGIMDRGFCSLERIAKLKDKEGRFFVLRIKNNISLKMLDNGKFKIGTGKDKVEARVVMFSDIEERTEFRLVTNLAEEGEGEISNEEIGEFYRLRWQVELLWKFLKMHLKLDRLITKNTNGIEIQIYCCLIGYLILRLVEIPQEFGSSLLDKLRYLQAFMCEKISYVHWLKELVTSC